MRPKRKSEGESLGAERVTAAEGDCWGGAGGGGEDPLGLLEFGGRTFVYDVSESTEEVDMVMEGNGEGSIVYYVLGLGM